VARGSLRWFGSVRWPWPAPEDKKRSGNLASFANPHPS
jgi:hypothetical protein